MTAITDFLVHNYFWFLVITLVLIFALIGYFVDEKERKKGLSLIDKPKEPEKNIHDLAVNAVNKSLNTAVNDSVKTPTSYNEQPNTSNTITDTANPQNNNPYGFNVLKK